MKRRSAPDHVGWVFKTSTRDFCLIYELSNIFQCLYVVHVFLSFIYIILNSFYFSLLLTAAKNGTGKTVEEINYLCFIILFFCTKICYIIILF